MMKPLTVERMTSARMPTNEGIFRLCLYHNDGDAKEHLALVMGDVQDQTDVLVRVHSECFTGDVLGSLRCDCGPQLNHALALIAQEGRGVVVYLRQEGRGIGLLDKLRAYNLQDQGYDTVEANLLLGHQADAREYTVAALILRDLGVRSLRLLTNNPSKLESLQRLGLEVTDRVPLVTQVTQENAAYLTTKVIRMRHLLDLDVLTHRNGNGTGGKQMVEEKPRVHGARPFTTLSYAQSLNGTITARRGQPAALSGQESLLLTHKLRADHDAILVGVGTVLADDPRLNVRLTSGTDPQPVIVDSQLRFPLTARLWQENGRSPWIATTDTADPQRQAALEAAGARVIRLPADAQGWVNLTALTYWLAEMGVNRLMVEGGAAIITSFLAQRLVDRVVLTIAPLYLTGLMAVEVERPFSPFPLPRLGQLRYQQLGEDIVVFGEVQWPT